MDDVISRIRRGDEEAYSELVRVHYPGLFDFTYHYTRSVQATEDILQDVFLNIWEKRAGWRPDQSVRAYLYGAARNRAFNYLRSRKETAEPDTAHLHSSEEADAELNLAELSRAYRVAVSELPERRREVFRLSRLYGLTYAEIAEVLGISINTVRSQVSAALEHLRRRLADHL